MIQFKKCFLWYLDTYLCFDKLRNNTFCVNDLKSNGPSLKYHFHIKIIIASWIITPFETLQGPDGSNSSKRSGEPCDHHFYYRTDRGDRGYQLFHRIGNSGERHMKHRYAEVARLVYINFLNMRMKVPAIKDLLKRACSVEVLDNVSSVPAQRAVCPTTSARSRFRDKSLFVIQAFAVSVE